MVVKSAALTLALGLFAFGFGGTASAQSAGAAPPIKATDAATDATTDAYAQARPKRARTRIRVTPRCPYRTVSTNFPVPYECEYPGPGFVRQCVAQLVKEYRPSGTVIVPTTHCWWERG
jgi:hypothetical protein